jgi:hypothetical protein
LVERDATDGAVTTAFTAQHQTLLEQNNALEATLEASPEKSVFDEATLTGYWKLPVIKGLNYQTPTHPAGVTDETGAFKCQPRLSKRSFNIVIKQTKKHFSDDHLLAFLILPIFVGVILLMVLSVYYLVRRKRLTT